MLPDAARGSVLAESPTNRRGGEHEHDDRGSAEAGEEERMPLREEDRHAGADGEDDLEDRREGPPPAAPPPRTAGGDSGEDREQEGGARREAEPLLRRAAGITPEEVAQRSGEQA